MSSIDSMNSTETLSELGASLNSCPVQINCPDEIVTTPVIKTPHGYKHVTRVEKPSSNKDLGGLAIPDFDTYHINNRSRFPKDYTDMHERNHLRELETSGIEVIDELVNRKISDEQYRKITKKHIDTVGDYVKQITKGLEKRYGKKGAEELVRRIERMSDYYVRLNEGAVSMADIQREYQEDLRRERVVKEQMPKKCGIRYLTRFG